ncbi:MAG: Maf family protein, partial [Luminiphilus sp.]|nr:Maf family protein [Luminiphilus sp.]
MSEVVLASASPRRRHLLSLLLADFRCLPMDVDESVLKGETAERYVLRLARLKAQAALESGRVVIGSDTTVCLRGELLHKPQDY